MKRRFLKIPPSVISIIIGVLVLLVWLFIILVIVSRADECYGDCDIVDDGGYLQDDSIFEGRMRIYDSDGGYDGYMEQDPFNDNEWIIRNRDGSRRGVIRRDRFFNDRYRYEGN